MEAKELLRIQNLSAWYTPSHPVLSDLSIELGRHEIIGMIGLNGAGKTIFIKTLSGLHSRYKTELAKWNGQPFFFRDARFKENRYTVFAEDHSFRYFTFREYLDYVLKSYGKNKAETEELTAGFHFEEYTDILLKDLSTGNLKKAYLITAFALQPELLLLDEPVNGLDFQSTEFLYDLINDYRSHGTILFSSHILESICLTADRVLVLADGHISQNFTGTAVRAENIREVLKNDNHNESLIHTALWPSL